MINGKGFVILGAIRVITSRSLKDSATSLNS